MKIWNNWVCEHKTITAGEKKLFLTQNMQFWFVTNEAGSYKIIPYITSQCKQVFLTEW